MQGRFKIVRQCQLRGGLKAADYGVKREKGGFWPEVSLVISDQYSDVGFDNLTSPPQRRKCRHISELPFTCWRRAYGKNPRR